MTTTAHRLKEATEQLLLEQGQARTTLREITDLAGVNVAAVNYHFGSKDALVAEVFGEVMAEVTESQVKRLERLSPDATLRQVVEVWLAPALPDVLSPREQQLWSLIHRGFAERAPGLLQHIQSAQAEVPMVLVDRLAALLPHLSWREIAFRHAAVLAAVAALRSSEPSPVTHALQGPDGPGLLVDWVVASFGKSPR